MLRQILSRLPKPLKRAGRTLVQRWTAATAPVAAGAESPGARWLRLHVESRRPRLRVSARPGQFSLLTSVYERTPPRLFRETAEALFRQTAPEFEWVLLAHGPIPAELDEVLRRIAGDPRVRLLRLGENRGIIGGVRCCLEAASSEYVIPLDADDLLVPDALQVLAQAIADHKSPPFLYTDEDILVNGNPQSPYLRPDWDPVLNLTSSYIWHLCAFRRDTALELGVYSDPDSNWCHDWDTVFRFANAGFTPVHVPEVVYHWRAHDRSSTNTADPNRGSLASQRHIVESQVARQPRPELYEIRPFPIFRGALEWWIARRRVDPLPAGIICCADRTDSPRAVVETLLRWLETACYPFQKVHLLGIPGIPSDDRRRLVERLNQLAATYLQPSVDYDAVHCLPAGGIAGFRALVPHLSDGMTVVCHSGAIPQGDLWPWESLRMFEFHDDLALIGGTIIRRDNTVIDGSGLRYDGSSDCPPVARSVDDPGPFGLFLKQRTVRAVNSGFFVAKSEFLRHTCEGIRALASLESLGERLGSLAAAQGRRAAVSPLVAARVAPGHLTAANNTNPKRERGQRTPAPR